MAEPAKMKPIRYTVLKENILVDLVKDVNLRIQAGWVPLGNVSVSGAGHFPTYYQVMVQYEEGYEPKPA